MGQLVGSLGGCYCVPWKLPFSKERENRRESTVLVKCPNLQQYVVFHCVNSYLMVIETSFFIVLLEFKTWSWTETAFQSCFFNFQCTLGRTEWKIASWRNKWRRKLPIINIYRRLEILFFYFDWILLLRGSCFLMFFFQTLFWYEWIIGGTFQVIHEKKYFWQ